MDGVFELDFKSGKAVDESFNEKDSFEMASLSVLEAGTCSSLF